VTFGKLYDKIKMIISRMGESGLAIKKTYRVKRSKDFDHIFSAKHSFANKRFVIYKLDAHQAHFRAGISVSKKLGHAVVRNRVKRLIRHSISEFAPYLTDEDFVVIARQGVESLDFHEVKKNLKHVLKLSKNYVDGEND
jgi:ribonuclease P protein component